MNDQISSRSHSGSVQGNVPPQPASHSRISTRLLGLMVGLALLLGLVRRLVIGWDAPLWLDEIFTGVIAIQPTFKGLIDDCLHELGGPVYYGLMWLWAKLAGASDVSLRLPSLLFALATPLLILFGGHPDRATRWAWSALAALWLPGAYYASEARSYSFLFLLACLQIIWFRQLLTAPDRHRALRWCAVSALMILTHYHSLLLVALQGLAFLTMHRGGAFRTWPAALIFIPVGAWMVVHLPLHLRFASPDVAWQKVLVPGQLVWLPDLMFGLGKASYLLFGLVVITFAADLWRWLRGRIDIPYSPLDLIVIAASVGALLVVFGLGFVRPSFTPRYLISYMPGVLLGLSLWARRWDGRWRLPTLLLVAAFALIFLRDMRAKLAADVDFRRGYSWDRASSYLRWQGVDHVMFLWDNPNVAIFEPRLLGRVGTFFFERSNYPVTSTGVKAAGTDKGLRQALLAGASSPSLRSKTVGTLSLAPHARHLRLSQDDPRWTCKLFGGPAYGSEVFVTACHRRANSK